MREFEFVVGDGVAEVGDVDEGELVTKLLGFFFDARMFDEFGGCSNEGDFHEKIISVIWVVV